MKEEKIIMNYRGKKISLDVKRLNLFGRFTGLMFTRKEKAKALFFDFGKYSKIAIHSWFVFFPFIAVWLDEKNNILEIKKINSFQPLILPEKKFVRLVEIPINKRYKSFLFFSFKFVFGKKK